MPYWCITAFCLMVVIVLGDGADRKDDFDLLLNEIDDDITEEKPVYETNDDQNTIYGKEQSDYLVCPERQTPLSFFTLPCFTAKDCSFFDQRMLCCNRRCVRGITRRKQSTIVREQSAFFGVRRACPLEPLVEIFRIKECSTDRDCFPRICCPDDTSVKGGYCRTPMPDFEKMPAFLQPLKSFMSYMQCTPPPPPFLDFFPKPCRNQFDCFPNLCCQEKGKKICRPPKRSMLTLLSNFGQRFGASEITKRFISRITV